MTIKGKIGFEIECFAKRTNDTKLRSLCTELHYVYDSDGSVRDFDYDTEQAHEFKSRVYNLTELKQVFKDVRRFYKLINVNRSCGLHIHLSFEKMSDYYKLLCWKFIEQFQNAYNLNFVSATEQERKTNRYSKFYDTEVTFNLDSTDQIIQRSKASSRYHCINFNAFNHYKTVEFRIFPATNKILVFKKYINFLIKNVDDFLKNESFKEFIVEKKSIRHPKPNEKIIIREVITKEEIRQIKNQINNGENPGSEHYV